MGYNVQSVVKYLILEEDIPFINEVELSKNRQFEIHIENCGTIHGAFYNEEYEFKVFDIYMEAHVFKDLNDALEFLRRWISTCN